MSIENQRNRDKNLVCMSEKQMTWCIFLTIGLLCILMLASYIIGYRSAIRTIVEHAKKDSFADQIYTSLTTETLMMNNIDPDQCYLQCTIKNYDDIQNIMRLGSTHGVSFTLDTPNQSTLHNQEGYHSMTSSVIQNYDTANALGTLAQKNVPSLQYDIVSIKKTNTEIERPFS